MVLRLWLQLWVLKAGMTPKQQTAIIQLNFYARIFKGLRGWNVPLPHVEELELSVNTAILSSGWDSLLVLYLGNPQQSGWEWAEKKITARLVLLCGQAHWLNLTFLPKMEKFGLKSMSKRRRNGSQKWRLCREGKIHMTLVPWKRLRKREWSCLLVQLCQLPERMKPQVHGHHFFETWQGWVEA